MIKIHITNIDKTKPRDSINSLVTLTKFYCDLLDYEKNVAMGIIESIKSTPDSDIDVAIDVFMGHFGEYVDIKD